MNKARGERCMRWLNRGERERCKGRGTERDVWCGGQKREGDAPDRRTERERKCEWQKVDE